MKNPVVYYAVIALGVVALIAGLYMRFAVNFHGKAYAVIALGIVCLAVGVGGMFVLKPKTA